MRRRQRLSLTGGLEGSERQSLEDPDRGDPSRPAFRAGTVMRRRGARSPTTVRGSSPGSPARPSSCAPRIVERCFAHNLDRGGMRRTWLRGRENVHKRYLLHVAGHNLSLLNAPAHRRRHPAGGRGGRIWRYFRSAQAHRGHDGGTGGLAKRPDGFRRRIPHLGVRAEKSHLINGLIGTAYFVGFRQGLDVQYRRARGRGRRGRRSIHLTEQRIDRRRQFAGAQTGNRTGSGRSRRGLRRGGRTIGNAQGAARRERTSRRRLPWIGRLAGQRDNRLPAARSHRQPRAQQPDSVGMCRCGK